MDDSIATVINFSTNEARFLGQCIAEALRFSSQVIAVVCDHFFDGTPEDAEMLEAIYAAHPACEFIEFAYSSKNIYSGCHWHNWGRLLGYHFLQEKIDKVLFLDVDEIVDGERFKQWTRRRECAAQRLACYWYFREASLRARAWEDTPLLIQRDAVTHQGLMHPSERMGLYLNAPGRKERMVVSSDGKPLVHHYSWVRSKEEMLRKVRSWGHASDRNWVELVEQEFNGPFSGRDFVHGYTYNEVPSQLVETRYAKGSRGLVRRLSTRDMHKIELSLRFRA